MLLRPAGAIRAVAAAVRAECRRPASIVAFGLAACATALPLLSNPVLAMQPWLAGGMAAIAAAAAVGDLPAGRSSRAAARETLLWAVARSLFPVVGLAAGAGVVLLADRGAGAGAMITTFAAVVSTASCATAVRMAGATSADAVSIALAPAVVASVTRSAWPVLALSWPLVAGLVAWGGRRTIVAEPADRPRSRGRTPWFTPIPGQSAIRGRVTVIAMGACLAGMAAWLLPAPPLLEPYACLALGVVAVLAFPMMTLGDGACDRVEWGLVLHGRADWPPAARIGFGHAAVAFWPLLVALVVRFAGFDVPHTGGVLAVVGATLASSVGLARGMSRCGVHPETSHALLWLAGGTAFSLLAALSRPS